MRGALHLDHRVRDRHRKSYPFEDRQVRQIVSDVRDFFIGNSGPYQNSLVSFQLFGLALRHEFHAAFARPSRGGGRIPASDYARAYPHNPREFQSRPVVRVEHFHFGHAAVRKCLQADVPGRDGSVHIHQQDADRLRAAENFRRKFDFANDHGDSSD